MYRFQGFLVVFDEFQDKGLVEVDASLRSSTYTYQKVQKINLRLADLIGLMAFWVERLKDTLY